MQQIEKKTNYWSIFESKSQRSQSNFFTWGLWDIFAAPRSRQSCQEKLGSGRESFSAEKKTLSWFLVEKSVFDPRRSILKMFKNRERKITHLLQIWSNLILFLLLYWIWSQMHLKILHFLSLCIKGCVFRGGIVPLNKFKRHFNCRVLLEDSKFNCEAVVL